MANNKLQPRRSINYIAVRNFLGFSDRSFVTAYEPIFILKGGGGARNFGKYEKSKGLNQKLFRPKSVRFFAQNQVKSRKKRSSLKFGPIFHPKSGEEQKQKKRSSLKFGLICLLFYAILQSWRSKGGAMAQCHGTMPWHNGTRP